MYQLVLSEADRFVFVAELLFRLHASETWTALPHSSCSSAWKRSSISQTSGQVRTEYRREGCGGGGGGEVGGCPWCCNYNILSNFCNAAVLLASVEDRAGHEPRMLSQVQERTRDIAQHVAGFFIQCCVYLSILIMLRSEAGHNFMNRGGSPLGCLVLSSCSGHLSQVQALLQKSTLSLQPCSLIGRKCCLLP